jgi:hypothetical protein
MFHGTLKEDECGPFSFQSSLGAYEGFVSELITDLLFIAELSQEKLQLLLAATHAR